MLEEMIVRYCSPTLAGLKTGNLFNCDFACRLELLKQIQQLNTKFKKKDLNIIPLRFGNSSALIYLYRPLRLKEDLASKQARYLLERYGYGGLDASRCVERLIIRLNEQGSFPHEIGLFLGFPPEDVKGFIDNRAKEFKISGFWKVYGDVQSAQKLFIKYKKCTECFIRRRLKGNTLECMIV